MDYYKYYIEIRNRAIFLFLTWIFTIIISYYYKEIILFFVLNSVDLLNNLVYTKYFIFTDLTEIFYVYIILVFFVSNQVLFFTTLYHIFMFLSLGLYHFEYSRLKAFIKLSIISFLIAIVILNKLILPLSWEFFLNFQDQDYFKPIPFFFEAKLSEYLSYYINLYYLCLINCYISSFLLFFAISFSKNTIRIRQMRKHFYFVFVLISTLTTPPDVISQVFIGLVLIFVYELMIFFRISSLINKATN